VLMAAAKSGMMDFVQLLLRWRADPSLRNSAGQNAEDLARGAGNDEIAELLKSAVKGKGE